MRHDGDERDVFDLVLAFEVKEESMFWWENAGLVEHECVCAEVEERRKWTSTQVLFTKVGNVSRLVSSGGQSQHVLMKCYAGVMRQNHSFPR